MAHDSALRQQAERLYVEEYQDLAAIGQTLGVSAPTLYRWAKEGGWNESREAACGMRDKLGKLLLKLVDSAAEDLTAGNDKIDAQRIHGLVNLLGKYQQTGEVREKLVMVEDAETLIETMKEMEQFRELLADQAVMAELGERLKEKVKKP